MKLLIQWTDDNPQNWVEIDSKDWSSLPHDRYIHSINVQGVILSGDWCHVEHLVKDVEGGERGEREGGCCRVTVVNDDPKDWSDIEKWAEVWTFKCLEHDPLFGGMLNTRQSTVIYAPQGHFEWTRGERENTVVKDWSHFKAPPKHERLYGIWLDDDLHYKHEKVRDLRGWRSFTEGVDSKQLDKNGEVKDQRSIGQWKKPKGTKTSFLTTTARANGIHVATVAELAAENTSPATDQNTSVVEASTTARLAWTFTSATDFPNDAAWPTGDYRCQFDVTVNDGAFSYGLLSIGGAAGHFARVNSGLTSDLETKVQTEAAFTGTGNKLATTGSVSWTTGAVGDRIEALIVYQRGNSHGNKTLTLQVGQSDDFIDGPWTAGSTFDESLTLTADSDIALVAQIDFEPPLALAADATINPTAQIDFEPSLNLSADATVALVPDNIIEVSETLIADADVVLADELIPTYPIQFFRKRRFPHTNLRR